MKIKIKINEGHGACGEQEAKMHRTTLAHLASDVDVLLRMIEDGDDLPEWLETKITKAGDYMSSAARYISGIIARDHGQLEELSDEKREELITNLTNKVMDGSDEEQEDFLDKNLQEYAMVDGYFDLYEALQDAIDEDGNTPCPQCLYETIMEVSCGCPDMIEEAIYQGNKVSLGKPKRGGSKKFYVYVKGCLKDKKKVKKISFGDPNMKIKKSNPKRRKSFRARHKCATAKDRCTARYWSCRKW